MTDLAALRSLGAPVLARGIFGAPHTGYEPNPALPFLDAPDPEVRVAAMVAIIGTLGRNDYLEIRRRMRAEADPIVRASFILGAVLCKRAADDEYPIEDPSPSVATAAAIAEALTRGSRTTREALATLEAAHAVAPLPRALFPWGDGDLAGLAQQTLVRLALVPIAVRLDELERAIREQSHDESGQRFLAEELIPRVFGRRRWGEPTGEQRRLAVVLTHLRSDEVQRLGTRIGAVDVRRALGIEHRPLRLRPRVEIAAWSHEHDLQLRDAATATTEVQGVRVNAVGVALDEVSIPSNIFAGSGAIGIHGGESLVDWIVRDGCCDTLRVLSLARGANVEKILDAPLLDQIRRLVIHGETRILESSRLGAVEALAWHRPDSLRAIASMPVLRELRLFGQTEQCGGTMDEIGALLSRVPARLTILELEGFEVPLELAASFALEELCVSSCTLRGTELLGALGELRVFRARGTDFDDAAAIALAGCTKLETIDLANTAVGDAGAAAIAGIAALRSLDLRGTRFRDLEIAAKLARVQALRLPHRVEIDLALRGRGGRVDHLDLARPRLTGGWRARGTSVAEAVASAISDGVWPLAPAGFARGFVSVGVIYCGACRGDGYAPDGPCGWHMNSVAIDHAGEWPRELEDVTTFAAHREVITAAEALGVQISTRMTELGLGTPRTCIWHLPVRSAESTHIEREARPHSLIEDFAPQNTWLWAHTALAEGRGDRALCTLAAEIADLGIEVFALEREAIHLALRPDA